MTSKKLLLAGLIAALGMAGSVQAATVTITPRVTAVLNADFSPVDPSLIISDGLLAPRAEPYLLQVTVRAVTTGLGGTAVGFSNTAFNTTITGEGKAVFDVDLGLTAWNPDNPPVDINGPTPGGGPFPKWDINSDDGAANDLNGVILAGVTKSFGPAQYDIRRTLTQVDDETSDSGSFYIELPGTMGASTSAILDAAFGLSTYDAEGLSSTAGNNAVGGATATWSVQVPEPSTLALLGLGSVLLAVARKRR